MKPLFGLALFLAATAAAAQTPPSPAWPRAPGGIHPAVARIIVTDRDGTSLGSGTLVAVTEHQGLVVTNWHVVRDAAGPITVAFPDGFRSAASVLRTDKDWDLAALAIWRPDVEPVPLAASAPRPGEPLAIAGYGEGPYRIITGRCTQYVSPGGNQPYEMVELSARARNGDSGGPIFNTRGELAGVLFGSARGETTGSYSGRVREFLTPAVRDFERLEANTATMIAAAQNAGPRQTGPSPSAAASNATPAWALASIPSSPTRGVQTGPTGPVPGAAPIPPRAAPAELAPPAARSPLVPLPLVPEGGVPVAIQAPTTQSGQQAPSEAGFWDQVKSVMAAVGAIAILFHTLRFLAVSPQPEPQKRRRAEED